MSNQQLAFVFPGQGSQTVGMLSDIADQFSEVKAIFADASSVLQYDLWRLVNEGPADQLDQTVHTQPALLAASYAIWKIIISRTAHRPVFLAGHSLGEYTALLCADAISFHDAIKLVSLRGQYMQDAIARDVGAMAAIVGLSDETIIKICHEAITSSDEVLSPANFNSIGQVVIAGHQPAVDRAILLAKSEGAKLVIRIPVSVPSHCNLMLPAAQQLQTLLASLSIATPSMNVVNNVDVKTYSDSASIRDGLVRQLYKPVRWVETIQCFAKEGITTIVECGPGKVLTGLNKRIDKQLKLFSTTDLASLNMFLNQEK